MLVAYRKAHEGEIKFKRGTRHAKRVSMPMGYIRFWGLIRESFGPVLKPSR